MYGMAKTLSSGGLTMPGIHLTLTTQTRKVLEKGLRQAEYRGDLRTAKRMMAILAIADGYGSAQIAPLLHVVEESIRLWVKAFVLHGADGLRSTQSPGRPPKLIKAQKRALERMISEGPSAAGYPGACWRTPMIQHLIYERFGVLYSVNYLSQLLKNMGFSYQKARFVSDHKDPQKRQAWLAHTWSEVMKLAKAKDAHIFFGDEASFPQWGTLTYTWAKRGQQPTVPTSGIRKGYKVFGLVEYFSGRFLYQGHERRFTSESYAHFLESVLKQTTQHIILIQDGARYHTSKAMQEFFAKHAERLTVYQLPSYSPDYNPIEKLWKKIKEDGTHLHYFPTFEALVNKVNEILPMFENTPEEVLSLFGFYRGLSNELDKVA
jgi:transposase